MNPFIRPASSDDAAQIAAVGRATDVPSVGDVSQLRHEGASRHATPASLGTRAVDAGGDETGTA
jgi:hypothetical protein